MSRPEPDLQLLRREEVVSGMVLQLQRLVLVGVWLALLAAL